jgi:hypothetical protein
MFATSFLIAAIGSFLSVEAVTIAELNGNKFLSPYSGQTVTNVTGVITAKSSAGLFIRSTTPDDDARTSESIYVYSSTVGANLTVGDLISLDAKLSEYRSTATYLYLTELASPKNVKVLSSGNAVTPLVIGEDTALPPTTQYTSLDGGDIFAVPNAVGNISAANPVLEPTTYGLDFWESLSGELVTLKNVTVISRPNNYRESWVVGGWPTTGRNAHGGLTMSAKGTFQPICAQRDANAKSAKQTLIRRPSLWEHPWMAQRTQLRPRWATRPRTSRASSSSSLGSTTSCRSPRSRLPRRHLQPHRQ